MCIWKTCRFRDALVSPFHFLSPVKVVKKGRLCAKLARALSFLDHFLFYYCCCSYSDLSCSFLDIEHPEYAKDSFEIYTMMIGEVSTFD